MRLSTLAGDIISLITQLIDGNDLLNLYIAGDMLLCRLLSSYSKDFFVDWSHCPWKPLGTLLGPVSSILPNLSTMAILWKESWSESSSHDLETTQIRWTNLRRLDFQFLVSIDTLLLQAVVNQQSLPSLTELTVIERNLHDTARLSAPMSLSFLQQLPSTLVSLTLEIEAYYTFSCDSLPLYLAHLTLRTSTSCSFPLKLKGLTYLESLVLKGFGKTHVQYEDLPSSLQSLTLDREEFSSPPDWSLLFPHLTSLSVSSTAMLTGSNRYPIIPTFPPCLRRLSVPIKVPLDTPSAQLVELFAPILVDLKRSQLKLDLLERLPKLETAMIPQPDRFIKTFPTSLTTLTMLLMLPAQISLLPNTITKLACSIKGQRAPKYTYPTSLKKLVLRQCQYGPDHPMRYDYLPSSLTSLNIWAVKPIVKAKLIPLYHVGTLRHLDRLRFLSIGAVISSEQNKVSFPFEDASALPPSLTQLQLVGVAPTDNFWNSFSSQLPSLLGLESMMHQQEASLLLNLPSSLQNLRVEFRGAKCTSQHIESLPRSIQRLHISGTMLIPKEVLLSFSTLPPSLKYFCINLDNMRQLESSDPQLSLSNIIPITIAEFVYGHNVLESFIQRKKKHYANKRSKDA